MSLVSLKKTLEKILKEYNLTGDIDAYKVFSFWEDIVGEGTARHSNPVRMNEHVLYVEVDDPIWLSQLRYMKFDILDKVDRQIKKDAIKDIRFFLKRRY